MLLRMPGCERARVETPNLPLSYIPQSIKAPCWTAATSLRTTQTLERQTRQKPGNLSRARAKHTPSKQKQRTPTCECLSIWCFVLQAGSHDGIVYILFFGFALKLASSMVVVCPVQNRCDGRCWQSCRVELQAGDCHMEDGPASKVQDVASRVRLPDRLLCDQH